jgi:hypothetical protein
LGDDDPRLLGHRLHGVSPEVNASIDSGLIKVVRIKLRGPTFDGRDFILALDRSNFRPWHQPQPEKAAPLALNSLVLADRN